MREIGQDASEVLDYEPGTFHVVRHVRPKLDCVGCHTITQALAPSRPMDRCMAGAGLLTHIAVSKFADHVPLYRLCQIYGRDGVKMCHANPCRRHDRRHGRGCGGKLLAPVRHAQR